MPCALSNGNIVVCYKSNTFGGTGFWAAVCQIVDASGNKIGLEFSVSDNTGDHRVSATCVSFPAGGFVAVWAEDISG